MSARQSLVKDSTADVAGHADKRDIRHVFHLSREALIATAEPYPAFHRRRKGAGQLRWRPRLDMTN
jgi:hypothetical protein